MAFLNVSWNIRNKCSESEQVPPQKIVITNESGAELTSVVGPFSEGASFTLRCDVFGEAVRMNELLEADPEGKKAKPLPTVTWFRNDVMVSNVSIALPSGGTTHVRSELRITGLGRRDVHSELTCQALNNPKTAPLASTLHVDMNFGPLDVKILGANQPLSAGRRYDLLCQSSGSRPPAILTWRKNGQRLEKAKKTTVASYFFSRGNKLNKNC
ncbi:hypothetical protein GEV33_012052 [Tenebrio molitor]|uniref:Ig-like domain-containing protein n=1 Tax=Tenebrio molitor TaxID=7067 RepID=A0A8J6H9T7_TENMO|nr:hypothetical protein GEV33_012052 [Tenebrio molitor]